MSDDPTSINMGEYVACVNGLVDNYTIRHRATNTVVAHSLTKQGVYAWAQEHGVACEANTHWLETRQQILEQTCNRFNEMLKKRKSHA